MNWLTVVSLWLIPMILLMILLHAAIKKVPAYDLSKEEKTVFNWPFPSFLIWSV